MGKPYVFITIHAKVWKKLYSTQEPRGFSHREVQRISEVQRKKRDMR